MRGRGPGFGEVLGVAEFRALWAAELLSILGDQLARVALALLVFQRTSSAALSALTYALTFAPAVLGGALLSGLADRYPRRRVLIGTDLLRAVLAAAMAIPSLPLPAMWALVAALSMAAAPFKAAQQALLPQVLSGDRYLTGLSLRQVTTQGAQLVGYASGGFLLAALEPHAALAVNAATFLASALLITVRVRPRPAPQAAAAVNHGQDRPARERRLLLPVIALVCLAGFFVVLGGVSAPYGAAIGAGSVGVGLLMAADPMGSVIGAWLVARCGIRPTMRSAVVLAAASGIPLIACVLAPGAAVTITLAAVSGALSTAYLVLTQAIVVRLVPDHRRGRVMGQIAACLYSAQGLMIFIGGVVTEAVGPFRAVAGAGLLGSVFALSVGIWWQRVARSRRDLATGSEHDSGGGPTPSPVLLHDRHLLPRQRSTSESSPTTSRSPVLLHDRHLLPQQRPTHDTNPETDASPVLLHDRHLLPHPRPTSESRSTTSRSPVLLHVQHLLPNPRRATESNKSAAGSPVLLHDRHLLPHQWPAYGLSGGTGLLPVLLHDWHLLPGRTPRRRRGWIMAVQGRFGFGIAVVGTRAPQLWGRLYGTTAGRMLVGETSCG